MPGHSVNGVTMRLEGNSTVIDGLPEDQTPHRFAVRHIGAIVDEHNYGRLFVSHWSSEITISSELDTPSGLSANQTAAGQVSLDWDAVEDTDHYLLRFWMVDRWQELDGADDSGITVTMSGATAEISNLPADYYWYMFEVKALGANGIQQSGWSHHVSLFNQHHAGNQ